MNGEDGNPLNAMDRLARLFAGNQFVSSDGEGRRDVESVEGGEAGSGCNLHGIPHQRRTDRSPMANDFEETFVERKLLLAPME
jgi:hypothetical protein